MIEYFDNESDCWLWFACGIKTTPIEDGSVMQNYLNQFQKKLSYNRDDTELISNYFNYKWIVTTW